MQEEGWLRALRSGCLDWFPELVETYQHRIYALAYRKTGNAADAEDLAQEIFLQFYRKLPLFRGDASLSTWLYRVAFNRAASYRREHKRWFEAKAVEGDIEGGEVVDDRLLSAERQQAVRRAMSMLRQHEREVLELFYFQRYTTARIAEILGLAPRGVETRLRRARERMKKHLAATYCFEEEENEHGVRESAGAIAAKLY